MRRYAHALGVVLVLASFLGALAGCAGNRPIPETPGQTTIDAYGVLEKAAVLTTVLMQNGVITVDQAKQRRDQIAEAKQALDVASNAMSIGDLSTAIGKLEAAKTIVDALNAYVNERGGQ
jgi:hypothetical protein